MILLKKNDVVSNAWDVVAKDLEFFENFKGRFILVFILYLGWQINQPLKGIVKFVLFSLKNNQEGKYNDQKR